MTEIIVEAFVNETVIDISGGPTLSTIVDEVEQTIVSEFIDPIVIDLNSGPQGEPGAAIVTGEYPPDPQTGVMGDLYIVTEGADFVGQVFRKVGPLTWEDKGNVRGPAGGVNTVNGYTGPDVTLTKDDIGLTNIVNLRQVDLENAQTIGGVKTFSSAPVVPNASFSIAKVSGLQTNLTGLQGDINTRATDSTVVHLAGAESISGAKTFTVAPIVPTNSFAIDRIIGLQTALNSKSDNTHTHAYSSITGLPSLGTAAPLNVAASGNAAVGEVVKGNDTRLSDARTPLAHTHAITDTTGLQAALDAKANTVHAHTIANVTGLQAALDSKSASTHTHPYSAITGLPTLGTAAALDVPASGDASVAQVVKGNDSRLVNARTPLAHTHAIADLPVAASGTSSTTLLVRADDVRLSNARAPLSHTHAIADTTGLQAALDAKETPAGAQTKATTALNTAKSYTDTSVAAIIDTAPATLDTLNELAAALGDDPNFATTISNQIGTKEPVISAGTTAQYWRGDKTWQTLNAATVGLGNVNNTSDLAKPISTATQTALNGKADTGHAHTYASITGKPATFPPEAHNHDDRYYTESEVDAQMTAALNLKADASHNHDDRYFTQDAIGVLFNNRAPLVHTHAIGDVTNLQASLNAKQDTIAVGTTAQYFRGDKTWQILNSSVVGLGNVPNVDMRNLSNATSGTVADARLPARLQPGAQTTTDWNNVTANGWYMATGAANAPVASEWLIGEVVVHDASWVTQTVWEFTTQSSTNTKAWRRSKNAGTWTSWYRVTTSQAELDARYQQNYKISSGVLIAQDLVRYSNNSPSMSRYMRVNTKLPTISAAMLRMRISGMTNFSGAGTFDGYLTVYLYNTEGGTLYQPHWSATGMATPAVSVAKDASNNMVVILDRPDWGYPNITVDELIVNNGHPTEAQVAGWTITNHADHAGLTAVAAAETWDVKGVIDTKAPIASPTFTGTISGNGSGLTNLNASNLASGTVPQARMVQNIQRVVFTTAGTARPAGATYVEWMGPVQPANMVTNDTWINTGA